MLTATLSHTLEAIAMSTGIINTYLAARASIWNWLFGMITVALFFILFFDAKLYADMGSQVIFFSLQVYGIYQWLYGGKNKSALPITYTPRYAKVIAFSSSLIIFISLAYILKRYTDSSTIYLDACTTSLSLVAQWMMGRKWVENWIVWVLMDIISLQMYVSKQLYLITILYFILLIQSINGYMIWKKHAANKLAVTAL